MIRWRAMPQGVRLVLWVGGLALLAVSACTRESLRIAVAAQERADRVQQAVFERQHEALRILLYRDLIRQLEQGREPLTTEQQAIVNQAWNDRDLFEFWTVQQERARALRLIGVDAKLASDQAVIDLLIKALEAKLDRVEHAVAEQVADAALDDAAASPQTDPQ